MRKGQKQSTKARAKISKAIKLAYKEGRLHCPTKNPEVAKKISEAKKLHNPARDDPAVGRKISETLKRRFAAGELKPANYYTSNEARKRSAEKRRGRIVSEEVKRTVSIGVKKAWADEKYKNRINNVNTLGSYTSPEEFLILKPLQKLGFTHQHRIYKRTRKKNKKGRPGNYFQPDFTHHNLSICIEVDGRTHTESPTIKDRDQRKQIFLTKRGYTILRFTTTEVSTNPKIVIKAIKAFMKVRQHT